MEATADEPAQPTETWAVKKRKRAREKDNLLGVKLRKSSSANSNPAELLRGPAKLVSDSNPQEPKTMLAAHPQKSGLNAQESPVEPLQTPQNGLPKPAQVSPAALESAVVQAAKSPTPTVEKSTPPAEKWPPAAALGLGAYSSDED